MAAASRPRTKIVIPSYTRISADEHCLVVNVGATIKHWDLEVQWAPKCIEVAINTKGKGEGEVVDQLRRLFGENHKNIWIAMELRKAAEVLDSQPPRSPRFEAVYAESPVAPVAAAGARKQTKTRKQISASTAVDKPQKPHVPRKKLKTSDSVETQ